MRPIAVGIDAQRGLELADGVVQTTLHLVGQAQAKVRIGVVGIDEQTGFVLADSFIHIAETIGEAGLIKVHLSQLDVRRARKCGRGNLHPLAAPHCFPAPQCPGQLTGRRPLIPSLRQR